ncbi:MAG: hypothetical protein MUC28_02285 [Planctomycetes bacterium]|jgi:hypothetical protein|nr:hypothetical protein [Planctomycetota bacterium]
MRISKLQKYILTQAAERKGVCPKAVFYGFYPAVELEKNRIAAQTALQKSLDNLVEKDLIVAYGYRTARKWHIERVKFTAAGRKLTREIIKNRQKRLPKI